MTRQRREAELFELLKSDHNAIVKIWLEAAGTPAHSSTRDELDFRHVVIPAILNAEFKHEST